MSYSFVPSSCCRTYPFSRASKVDKIQGLLIIQNVRFGSGDSTLENRRFWQQGFPILRPFDWLSTRLRHIAHRLVFDRFSVQAQKLTLHTAVSSWVNKIRTPRLAFLCFGLRGVLELIFIVLGAELTYHAAFRTAWVGGTHRF